MIDGTVPEDIMILIEQGYFDQSHGPYKEFIMDSYINTPAGDECVQERQLLGA